MYVYLQILSTHGNSIGLTPTCSEHADETNKAFQEFTTLLLSDDTAVRRSYFAIDSQVSGSENLDEDELNIALNVSPKPSIFSRAAHHSNLVRTGSTTL